MQVGDLPAWKAQLATEGMDLINQNKLPRYDAIFVDEAQDLVPEEVGFLRQWGKVLFFVGDDRQKIYGSASGLKAIRESLSDIAERKLEFHYRIAPEICRVADRLLQVDGGQTLNPPAITTALDPVRSSRMVRAVQRTSFSYAPPR